MILTDVKQYLIKNKEAGLDDISLSLKADRQIVLHALQLLIRKGTVLAERQNNQTPCRSCSGTCGCCSTVEVTVYRINP